ncbi:MAG TPA: S8 family serine peptidase, partial [Longimicrobiaceae bacterium]|nr:S8 family serine peptidase [Longimicrobiaceae bacterium]
RRIKPSSMEAALINDMRDRFTAFASVQSLGGISLFSGRAEINAETIHEFTHIAQDLELAIRSLEARGFTVAPVDKLTVRVSGSAELFTRRFGVTFEPYRTRSLFSQEVSPQWIPSQDSMLNLLNTNVPGVEGIVFPEPISLHAIAPHPPRLNYHHLVPPDDLVELLNARPVHEAGCLGEGVKAAMIDSGFSWTHPYFTTRGYSTIVSLPERSDSDSVGHGTGESANLLAIAPRVTLHGLVMDDVIEALATARDDLRVQLISNSWGTHYDTDGKNGYWAPFWSLVQAEIALCVSQGIVVLFSSGNGGMSFTASMPETISVGGVYVDERGELEASNYASSFDSTRFAGVHVPDVCGLVGMQPRGVYIALPVPPESEVDAGFCGGHYPDGDETAADDGWAVFSGTSAACPMVAGAAALILSKYPDAGVEEVRARLLDARDVVKGYSAMNDSAGPGYDAATGYGLVDVSRACA